MKAKATIRLPFSSERHLATLLSALKPETNAPTTSRAKTILEKEENSLVLKVEAEDTIALRATLNAYLRWIGSAVKVIEVIERA